MEEPPISFFASLEMEEAGERVRNTVTYPELKTEKYI